MLSWCFATSAWSRRRMIPDQVIFAGEYWRASGLLTTRTKHAVVVLYVCVLVLSLSISYDIHAATGYLRLLLYLCAHRRTMLIVKQLRQDCCEARDDDSVAPSTWRTLLCVLGTPSQSGQGSKLPAIELLCSRPALSCRICCGRALPAVVVAVDRSFGWGNRMTPSSYAAALYIEWRREFRPTPS